MKNVVVILSCSICLLMATELTHAAMLYGTSAGCGGCSDPCAGCGCGGCAAYSAATCGGCGSVTCGGSSYAGCGTTTVARSHVDIGPTTAYRIVMKPEYYTIQRRVCTTEYQNQERQRVVKTHRLEPITEERQRVKCEWTTVSKSKTIEYQKTVQEVNYKEHTYTSKVPVWSTEEYEYSVKVPQLVDKTEMYYVSEPTVLEVPFTYTVRVPRPVTETRYRTLTNVVPVTKTRTIQHCVPVTRTEMVTKDYGHWETQVVEVGDSSGYVSGGSSGCGGCASGGCGGCASCGGCGCRNRCGGCGGRGCGGRGCGGCGSGCGGCATASSSASACGTRTRTQRVWVPNVRTEEQVVVDSKVETQEVEYTVYEQHEEQIPYECTYLAYETQERTGTKKKVEYTKVPRERTVKVVEYVDEPRTGSRKVLSYKDEIKTEKYPVISYRTEPATKDITWEEREPVYRVEPYMVTRQQRIEDQRIETYTARVPVPVEKLVDVQVCKMIPTVVEVTVNSCGGSTGSGGYSGGCGCGGSSGCNCGGTTDCGCQNAPAASSDCPCG